MYIVVTEDEVILEDTLSDALDHVEVLHKPTVVGFNEKTYWKYDEDGVLEETMSP